MAPHSSTLAWKIPWTEEPGALQSMGSLGVGHDCATSLSLFTFMHQRRKWQPTPVFLPGESQGLGSLVGCRLWGRTESDTTEVTQHSIAQHMSSLPCGSTLPAESPTVSDLVNGITQFPGLKSEWLPNHLPLSLSLSLFLRLVNHMPLHRNSIY